MLAKANVAPVTPSVAVAAPGVSLSDVMLVKMSVCPPLDAVETVPAWLAVIEIELVAGFAEMVKVFELPDVPLKVMLLVLVLAVETATVVDAAPAKVV